MKKRLYSIADVPTGAAKMASQILRLLRRSFDLSREGLLQRLEGSSQEAFLMACQMIFETMDGSALVSDQRVEVKSRWAQVVSTTILRLIKVSKFLEDFG